MPSEFLLPETKQNKWKTFSRLESGRGEWHTINLVHNKNWMSSESRLPSFEDGDNLSFTTLRRLLDPDRDSGKTQSFIARSTQDSDLLSRANKVYLDVAYDRPQASLRAMPDDMRDNEATWLLRFRV
ncbi:uncharacterized protein ARMOST_01656 [Armillaria ostoyae]|uniref:Uncharacterized protein n=1 Tax=Armillaria ostoyae TaxID=47428 RepID=A0A284QPQ0_ARMOS|nr:uncharacterized protein ARMOST_01656 [Armillaria ostoyae]